jgi:hypothetical protein
MELGAGNDVGPDGESLEGKYHAQIYLALYPKEKCTPGAQKLRDWGLLCHKKVATDEERSLERVEAYCQKDDTRVEAFERFRFGVPPSGKAGQSDMELIDLRKRFANGDTLVSMIRNGDVPWELLSKHLHFLKAAEVACGQGRGSSTKPTIYLLIGESGSGKSYWARSHMEEFFPEKHYTWAMNSPTGCWVTEDAAGKTCILIDEFRGNCPMDVLLRVLDYGDMKLPYKGGFINLAATTFIITSNLEPREWWPKMRQEHPADWEASMLALERRFREFATRPHYKTWMHAERLRLRAEAQREAVLARMDALMAAEPSVSMDSAPRRRISPVRLEPEFEHESIMTSQ